MNPHFPSLTTPVRPPKLEALVAAEEQYFADEASEARLSAVLEEVINVSAKVEAMRKQQISITTIEEDEEDVVVASAGKTTTSRNVIGTRPSIFDQTGP